MQAYRNRFSVPLSDERAKSKGGEARGNANAVAEGGNICKKETMQNYPHALINRKRRHPGIVLVCNETKEEKI